MFQYILVIMTDLIKEGFNQYLMFFGHSAHKHNSYVVKILAIARFDLFCDN